MKIFLFSELTCAPSTRPRVSDSLCVVTDRDSIRSSLTTPQKLVLLVVYHQEHLIVMTCDGNYNSHTKIDMNNSLTSDKLVPKSQRLSLNI